MKVLWVCNLPINPICKYLNIPTSGGGGWIEGLYNEVIKKKNIELFVCFPSISKEQLSFDIEGASCFSFYQPRTIIGMANTTKICKKTKMDISLILNKVSPDILHIFGTEFSHSRAFTEQFKDKEHIVVNIQGLSSMIGERFCCGLPFKTIYHWNLSSIVRGNIFLQQSKMLRRGLNEKVVLKEVSNVIGRTEWDCICAKEYNPKVNYYHCGENLRASFYTASKWTFNNCRKHTIFVSQGNYPIKGLHIMLKAMNIVCEKFPDAKLIVGGSNPLREDSLARRLLRSTYADYIKKLINLYDLKENVIFTGNLSEFEMIEQYQMANVFVLPSTIENSPNSLCEAMLIGTPSLAANVGGVSSIMQNIDYVYCYDDYHYLAGKINKIFEIGEKSSDISSQMIRQASIINNTQSNTLELLKIYEQIIIQKRV